MRSVLRQGAGRCHDRNLGRVRSCIWLYRYRSEENYERTRRQLLQALAAELDATRDILESKPEVRVGPPENSSEEEIAVVVTNLRP